MTLIMDFHGKLWNCFISGMVVPIDMTLRWRQNDHYGVSNHQPHRCLLNRFFRRRSKKTSKLRVTGLCAGNSPGPVNSPHKGSVTRKMFPFDDVIMKRKSYKSIRCWINCTTLTFDFPHTTLTLDTKLKFCNSNITWVCLIGVKSWHRCIRQCM